METVAEKGVWKTSAHPIDWEAAQEIYINATPAPTYASLAKQLGCSTQAVTYQARERAWEQIRTAKQELSLAKSKAFEIINKSIENEGPLLQQARQFVSEFFLIGQVLLQELGEQKEGKLSSRINCLNSLGFACANVGKLMDSAGLIGTAKAFGIHRREAERNGEAWDKGTMQQINVTVNGMTLAPDQPKAAECQATESKPVATRVSEVGGLDE